MAIISKFDEYAMTLTNYEDYIWDVVVTMRVWDDEITGFDVLVSNLTVYGDLSEMTLKDDLTLFIFLHFTETGKIVIVLAGRHAGKKAVVVKTFDEGNSEKRFSHCLIAAS